MDQSKALLSALMTAHVIEFIDFRQLPGRVRLPGSFGSGKRG